MSAKKLKRESAFARASSCCGSWRLLAVTALVGALAVLVTFLRLHWTAPASDLGIKFLINADQSKVVEAFRSASPHLFYCHEHGNPDYVPKKLQVAHQIMGVGDYRLAVMNCSQELPSGLQIFDRFKLKREWRPVVFATAPWLTGRVQVPPAKFAKKEGGLHAANYMLSALRPREKVIANDKEFQTTCGTISSSFGITELKSCVLALKGPLFSETQQDVLGHLVKTFHSTPLSIMSVNSKSRWLSMESSFVMSRKYSMRLYVIRNGTHYATLNLPPTKESSVEFVRNFVEAPTSSFTVSSSGIKLIKPPMISAAAESAAPRKKSTTEKNIANDMPSGKSNPGENEELQRQREQQRREQMDKQSENYIFIDNSDEYPLDAACDDMDESDVGEEDDEVIELF